MCGTPSYLAPEVVNQQDDEGYDNLVDSWSVGVIVFAMWVYSFGYTGRNVHSCCRVANSSPFLDDESCKSVKERILRRRIVWEPLIEKGVTQEGPYVLHQENLGLT
jgi:serine/threonine/tyrosine protein kinase RAD53